MLQQRTSLRPLTAKPQPTLNRRALTLAVHFSTAGLLAAPLLSQPAIAQVTQQQARHYDIASGPVSTAINRFAAQAGVFISGAGELGEGRQSPGLQGQYRVDEGLERLLDGTGLTAALQRDGSYRLEAGATNETLPVLQVEANWLSASPVGPDYGYRAERSLTATKADIALEDTPRTVSVITRERIEDQNPRTLSNILSYVPGISSSDFPVGDGLAGDIFFIRGMNQRDYGYGTYRDGLRVQPNAYSTSAEPYGLERVEVFKGPTSALYGENVPGGLVNLVSKRPTADHEGEVNLSYGSHSRRQISTDISGPLNTDGSVKGRVVFLHRESDTQIDSVNDDRTYIAPSLTFELSDQDRLTVLGMYQKDDSELQLGLPAAGTLLDHPSGTLSSSTNLGHPEWDTFEREVWSLGYEYEHAFNDSWRFQQNARYLRSQVNRQEVWWSYPGDGYDNVVGAYGRDRDNDSKTLAVDNRIVGKFGNDVVEHTWLAGFGYDRTSFSQTQDVGFSTPQSINIFNPQWSSPPQTLQRSEDGEDVQALTGIYSQLHSQMGGFIAQVGGRFDSAKTEYSNYLTPGGGFTVTDEEFSWQAGLMYQFDSGLSPYMNYATTFVPARQVSVTTNEPLDPITGRQYELGLRYDIPDTDTAITLSTYDIVMKNDINYDSAIGGYRNVGRTDSNGVELELVSDINDALSVAVAYTYTDARIVEDVAFPRYEDNQVAGVPRHKASLWANYEFLEGAMQGAEVGLGVRYLGSSNAYPDASLAYGDVLSTKAVTLADISLGYDFNDNWRVGLNVENLFDKQYVGECNNAARCYWGTDRTVQGTLSFSY
ncbi:TonB-dependent siderophore receptor [Vreelandella venusta]|uniref:TonB-dependent siderophore receptor n=1 Tax=Vreelandella venusta TaxID=44935 RepID=UPI00200E5442|nr:TonB-dependent siderophore receptor [Halomonas venusta]UQI41521.1 TonB-dependent siderophore receptor [Halomonas venusta]